MKWIVSLAFVVSLAVNAWLAIQLVDAGVAESYLERSLQTDRTTLLQCIAVTNEFLTKGARKEALMAKARSKIGSVPTASNSNDGHLWVGHFGMSFDESGRLMSIAEWQTVHDQITQQLE